MHKPIVAAICALSVFAPLCAQAGEVSHREIRQEHRIYQGVRGGSVTPGEYARLQHQESALNAERSRDLREGRPGLNRAQYRTLNRQENRLSHEIYRDKHDRH